MRGSGKGKGTVAPARAARLGVGERGTRAPPLCVALNSLDGVVFLNECVVVHNNSIDVVFVWEFECFANALNISNFANACSLGFGGCAESPRPPAGHGHGARASPARMHALRAVRGPVRLSVQYEYGAGSQGSPCACQPPWVNGSGGPGSGPGQGYIAVRVYL
jgi:hypothetical protein